MSVSIGTLALCALRKFSQAISNFVRLGEIDVLRGNLSVGRTALSDFNIDALVVEMVSVENEIDAGPSRSTPRGGGEADDAAPARSLGLAGCGMLQPEAFVDLVVLDPDRVNRSSHVRAADDSATRRWRDEAWRPTSRTLSAASLTSSASSDEIRRTVGTPITEVDARHKRNSQP